MKGKSLLCLKNGILGSMHGISHHLEEQFFQPCLPQWHKTSELLLLSGDLPSLQVHYSSHLSPSQTILIETVSETHNEQPLNGLVTAMHSHDWKSTFKVTTQVMHFHFIKKIVPEWTARIMFLCFLKICTKGVLIQKNS